VDMANTPATIITIMALPLTVRLSRAIRFAA
jgi:hypothetical protein